MASPLNLNMGFGEIKKKKKSVISKLTKEQQWVITFVAHLARELSDERIITPTQRGEITDYILTKMK